MGQHRSPLSKSRSLCEGFEWPAACEVSWSVLEQTNDVGKSVPQGAGTAGCHKMRPTQPMMSRYSVQGVGGQCVENGAGNQEGELIK